MLSYALTQVAVGNNQAALAKLSENESVIPVADLGLALALAGQPEQGVHYLVNAVRNGESTISENRLALITFQQTICKYNVCFTSK